MPLFSRKPAPGKLILILDVQSSMVRGSLVRLTAGIVPEIVFSSSAAIPHKEHVTSSYLIKAALKAIGQTVDDALRQDKVSEVHYVLSSPWILSQAKAVTLSLSGQKPVTRAAVMGAVSAERGRIMEGSDGKFEIVEEKVLDVRLNGYSVSDWQGKSAGELGISYALSIAGSAMLKRFREACERAAPARRVSFHSSLLLQHIGMRTVMPEKSDYLLIHVHAELTDVAVVERHACVFFGSYPLGLDSVLRIIARTCRCDASAAESLLTLYLSKSLDEAHMKSIEPALRDAGDGWAGELRKLFKSGSLSDALPEEAILSARAHERFFVKSLSSAYPREEATLLSEDMMSGHAAFAPGIARARLTALYAIALRVL